MRLLRTLAPCGAPSLALRRPISLREMVEPPTTWFEVTRWKCNWLIIQLTRRMRPLQIALPSVVIHYGLRQRFPACAPVAGSTVLMRDSDGENVLFTRALDDGIGKAPYYLYLPIMPPYRRADSGTLRDKPQGPFNFCREGKSKSGS